MLAARLPGNSNYDNPRCHAFRGLPDSVVPLPLDVGSFGSGVRRHRGFRRPGLVADRRPGAGLTA